MQLSIENIAVSNYQVLLIKTQKSEQTHINSVPKIDLYFMSGKRNRPALRRTYECTVYDSGYVSVNYKDVRGNLITLRKCPLRSLLESRAKQVVLFNTTKG